MPVTTSSAAGLREAKGSFELEGLEVDDVRPNEVRVRLVAMGVFHTDMVVRDAVYPYPLPAVLGHEGGGIVDAVGSAVPRVAVGDHVVLSAAYCGHCLQCVSGHGAYCENLFSQDFGGRREDGSTAFATKGGEVVSSHFFGQSSFSRYTNAVETAVVTVDRDVPLEQIAFFGCGMQTGAGSILNDLRPPAGAPLAVSGSGAVGLAAIMAAKLSGVTTIIALDMLESRLALAEELGAAHTVNVGSETLVDQIMRITGGKGADYVFGTTGIPQVLANLAGALAIRGTIALVGAAAPGTTAPFEIGASLTKGWTLKTIVQGSSVRQVFIPRLVELWKQGKFPADKLVQQYQLNDINTAFDDSTKAEPSSRSSSSSPPLDTHRVETGHRPDQCRRNEHILGTNGSFLVPTDLSTMGRELTCELR